MYKPENFKNHCDRWRILVGAIAFTISFSSNISAAQEGDDYLSTILSNTTGKVFRYKKMPVKVFIESGQKEERDACKQAFTLWRQGTDDLISFESVLNKETARVLIKFVTSPQLQEAAPGATYDGGHTLMEWQFQKKLLPLFGHGKAHVPPQVVEINLRALELRPSSQRAFVLQNIIAHELGHTIGLLGHSHDQGDLMYSKTDENSKLSPRDLNTVRSLYRHKANIYL